MNTQQPWGDETTTSNGRSVRENFDLWFSKSKVQGSKGNPLVCYHGTGNQFSVFGSNQDGGHYFSPCQETALFFSNNSGKGWGKDKTPLLLPVFLSIQDPMILDYDGLHSAISHGDRYDPQDADTIHWPSMPDLIEEAKQDGHDGMWLVDVPEYNGKNADQWIAFESHQIKCAVANNGLYEMNCEDIKGFRFANAEKAVDYLNKICDPILSVKIKP